MAASPLRDRSTSKFLSLLSAAVDRHELFRLERATEKLSYSANRFDGVERSAETAYAIRVVNRGRAAFACAGSLERPAALVGRLVDLARVNERRPIRFRAAPAPPAAELSAFENPPVEAVDLPSLIPALDRLVRRLRKGIPGAAVSLAVAKNRERLDLANSAGFLCGWGRRGISASLRADVAEPGNLLELAAGREGVDFAGLGLDEAAESLIERASLARRVVPFETGEVPVLFSPQALGDVLCALEAGLSGMAAALGLSPIRDRVGERILSERVTLIEDPRLPGSYRSCPFDDEGTPTARRALVERGELRGFLHTLESAAMRGEEPTGNALRMKAIFEARDARARPRVSRTNLVLEPGETPRADLLSGVRRGLYADTVIGSFIGNVVTGNFSGNLWLGYRIRNGKLDGRVKNALVSGNIYRLLGDDLAGLSCETPPPSEQASARLPWCLAERVTVSCG